MAHNNQDNKRGASSSDQDRDRNPSEGDNKATHSGDNKSGGNRGQNQGREDDTDLGMDDPTM